MKFSKVLILLIPLILMSAPNSLAQDAASAAHAAEQLRAQLRDAQAEEADLQAHLQQLDWDLRPENIERYFAGTGSTRPEELREQRRRQLQNEKERVTTRLAQLATSLARLESAISAADMVAYDQSAQASSAVGLDQALVTRQPTSHLPSALILAFIVTAGALAVCSVIHRRRRLRNAHFKSL